MAPFHLLNDDILRSILARLPAVSFASAACVRKSWNHICNQILSRPKLASALSLNPSLVFAVSEVVDKVLSQPIRPQFAIACIGEQFGLRLTHFLIMGKLGSNIPVITHASSGVIGIDALSNELREVMWEVFDYDGVHPRKRNLYGNLNRGIVLIVGFLPGLKIDAIPLLQPQKETQANMVDIFLKDIKDYTSSVSGCETPAGIIMFGDCHTDMKPILAKMDNAMPRDTAIVGDAGGCFLFSSQNYSTHYDLNSIVFDAVALVFARDKNIYNGETQFHVIISAGLMPLGPRLEAVSVEMEGSQCCWLSARIEGQSGILDCETILEGINDMMEDESPHLYIGVTQQREYLTGTDEKALGTSTSFYEVIGGNNEFFVVNGVGIKPGDSLLFYHSDMEAASISNSIAFENLKILKADKLKWQSQDETDNGDKKGVFGGLIFSNHSRGESCFRRLIFQSSQFSLNFSGVPLAGIFCSGEIGRASLSSIRQHLDQEQGPPHCCIHVYSTIYLVMSYFPAIP